MHILNQLCNSCSYSYCCKRLWVLSHLVPFSLFSVGADVAAIATVAGFLVMEVHTLKPGTFSDV